MVKIGWLMFLMMLLLMMFLILLLMIDEIIASMGSQPTTTVRNTHIKAAKSYPQL